MKTIKFLVLVNCLLLSQISFGQEKYAILICGANTDNPKLNGGAVWNNNSSEFYREEFYYDTFLMWKMLLDKGFNSENIFVHFHEGADYNNIDPYISPVYWASSMQLNSVTDFPCKKNSIVNTFTDLANELTQDDFLFVWTFGHGGPGPNIPGDEVNLVLTSGGFDDDEFAAYMDQINAGKKVFWMQQCRGGGFYDELQAENTVFISASQSEEWAFVADNEDVLGNSVIEKEEWPYGGMTRVYPHGEFNFHMYSSTMGESPSGNLTYSGQPYTVADINNDNCISMFETYSFEENHESINKPEGEEPMHVDLGGISAYTSLRFPTLMFEDITITDSHRGIIGVTKDVRVMPGQTLTLYDKAKVHFINDAKITVEAGASLVIGDNVEFIMDDPHGTSDPSHSAIIVRGNISIGSNVKFSSQNGHNWKGLDFDTMTTSYSLQGIEFDHCGIYGSARLTVSNCTFDNAHVSLRSSTSSFSQCNFTNSSIYANVATSLHTLEVNNCSFNGTNEDYVIYLSDYQDFDISGNSISYSSGDGISLYYCGHGGISMEDVSNNDIICSATSGTHYGVIAYQTDVDITNNTINGNSIGVASLNSSSSLLTGHTSVASLAQRITGNSQYQVYATSTSFPHTFEHNIIYGSSSPYVYAAGFYTPASLDVRNNYWGSNFNPSSHLYPSAAYDWFPVWTPNSYMLKESGPQDMLWQAMELVENGNYAQAENILKGIIDGYPEGEEAISATKVLYKMQAKHNSDYTGLKQYFQSTLELTEDTARMFRLLRSMVCWCDVKSGSLHQALSGFNQIIADPFDYPDQIFAELDKQYVEELVAAQGNLKSGGNSTLAARQFELTRDLFGEEKGLDNWLSEESPLANLSAYQKTSGTAALQFGSEVSGEIEISLYSIDGRLCQQWHVSIQKGANQIDVELNSVPKGVHLVCLRSVGGQLFGSVKLSL